MALAARFEGEYFSILYSMSGNSIKYLAKFQSLGDSLETLKYLSRKR